MLLLHTINRKLGTHMQMNFRYLEAFSFKMEGQKSLLSVFMCMYTVLNYAQAIVECIIETKSIITSVECTITGS